VSTIEVIIPDIGGAADVDVIEVCVNTGDQIAAEDSLIVLESDKASMDVPAPQAGVVKDIKVKVGDKVNEGDLILLLETESASGQAEPLDETLAETQAEPQAVNNVADGAQRKDSPIGGPQTVKVPDIGGFEDVTIIELCVAEGDQVGIDDPILVLESDKATMEVPSPVAGMVRKLLVAVNDKVSEGSDMVVLEVEGGSEPTSESTSESTDAPVEKAPAGEPVAAGTAPVTSAVSLQAPQIGLAPHAEGVKVHAGPAVRRVAREFGVDLTMIQGSGPKGRIVKEDVQAFVKSGLQQLKSGVAAATGTTGVGLPTIKLPDFAQFGKIARSSMTRIHQLTAENMSRSWLTVPHVTQFEKADITELEKFRKDQKVLAEKKGVRLTPLPFMIKACAYALNAFPQFNVSLDMDKHEVIQKHYINIGVAVDTPAGLVVPVLRDVDKKGIWDIAAEFADLADKAKDKKLKPAEMQGGCFTISSLGSIGGSAFTPIVNTPEVAILGISKAQTEPVYVGNDFKPRLMLPLCLSYDHRAINGADAARFTGLLAHLLGDIRNLLL
jgi:pyruvate dehydrogenase E2 component (dihydrolipoamide acetyltransferase)